MLFELVRPGLFLDEAYALMDSGDASRVRTMSSEVPQNSARCRWPQETPRREPDESRRAGRVQGHEQIGRQHSTSTCAVCAGSDGQLDGRCGYLDIATFFSIW